MNPDSDNPDRPIRLLLVDDERPFVDALCKRLARRGVETTKAYAGKTAVQLLKANDFDAAVLDLKMEDISGLEVLKIFKLMAPAMPVIMLTGHGSDQTALECIEAGAHECLTKPCLIDNLVERIRAAVKKEG
jgi:DNA-binding response OmpR family regulator